MANGAERPPQFPCVIDAATGKIETQGTPKGKRVRINLATIEDAHRELGRVYREMRTGKIPADVGTKLTFTLRTLCEIKMLASMKQRLAMLEQQLAQRSDLVAIGDDEVSQ